MAFDLFLDFNFVQSSQFWSGRVLNDLNEIDSMSFRFPLVCLDADSSQCSAHSRDIIGSPILT